MFGSTILDIAIGLVFVYCLYSLFTTIVNEIIASFLGLRGKMLEQAIRRMLTDDDPNSPLSDKLFASFFEHPIIRYMSEDGSRTPSYISPQDFSKALAESIKTAANAAGMLTPQAILSGIQALDSNSQSETSRLLQSFLEEANNDVVKFRALIEQWFNDMMDRASGWYKRQAQWISLVIGAAVAVAFNASTFSIASHLMQDKAARQELAQMASSYLQSHPQTLVKTDSSKAVSASTQDSLVVYATNLYKNDISQSNHLLGLGWSPPARRRITWTQGIGR